MKIKLKMKSKFKVIAIIAAVAMISSNVGANKLISTTAECLTCLE